MASSRRYEADYFTATILNWEHLLANDSYKNIIIESLRYLVAQNRIMVHAFVIMSNHMHILWHVMHPHNREDVQRDFLKFTAQTMLKEMRAKDTALLADFYVGAKDRKYQVWERNALSVPIWSGEVLKQKLDYIHNNPVKAGMCQNADDYRYSTAGIYMSKEDNFGFITPFYD